MDIKQQGRIGDCWLAAAISSLARFPRAVKKIFRQQYIAKDHRYQLQLFDPKRKKMVLLHVDDRVPVIGKENTTRLLGLQVSDMGESWPMLLEKAVAKLLGGYEELNSKCSGLGMNILTGDENFISYSNQLGRGGWSLVSMDLSTMRKEPLPVPVLSDEDLWKKLRAAHVGNRLMTAGIYKAHKQLCPSGCRRCTQNIATKTTHVIICTHRPTMPRGFTCMSTQIPAIRKKKKGLLGWFCVKMLPRCPKGCWDCEKMARLCKNSKSNLANCLWCAGTDPVPEH